MNYVVASIMLKKLGVMPLYIINHIFVYYEVLHSVENYLLFVILLIWNKIIFISYEKYFYFKTRISINALSTLLVTSFYCDILFLPNLKPYKLWKN